MLTIFTYILWYLLKIFKNNIPTIMDLVYINFCYRYGIKYLKNNFKTYT